MRNTFYFFVLFAVVCGFFRGSLADNGKEKVFSLRNDEIRDFRGAKEYCISKNKTLASVMSAEEQEQLEDIIIREGLWNSQFWIGGYYNSRTRDLLWQDYQPINYGKWRKGGKLLRNNLCVMVSEKDRMGYRWSTVPCGRKAYFICQRYM